MPIQIDDFSYELEPVFPDKPGWEVSLNGKIVEDVHTLTAINREMGIGFLYGRSPAGPYNQGRIVNRGGAVIVPTFEDMGEVYFLALKQVRPLLAPEPIYEFPRGQANKGEPGAETAARELLEETGIHIARERLAFLGSGNPDSAFFHGTNVHAWWLRLTPNFVHFDGKKPPSLKEGLQGNKDSRLFENILKSEFVHESEFASASMMTSWAMGLVLQQIRRQELAQKPLQKPPSY